MLEFSHAAPLRGPADRGAGSPGTTRWSMRLQAPPRTPGQARLPSGRPSLSPRRCPRSGSRPERSAPISLDRAVRALPLVPPLGPAPHEPGRGPSRGPARLSPIRFQGLCEFARCRREAPSPGRGSGTARAPRPRHIPCLRLRLRPGSSGAALRHLDLADEAGRRTEPAQGGGSPFRAGWPPSGLRQLRSLRRRLSHGRHRPRRRRGYPLLHPGLGLHGRRGSTRDR